MRMFDMAAETQFFEDTSFSLDNIVLQCNVLSIQDQRRDVPAKINNTKTHSNFLHQNSVAKHTK